MEKTFRPSCRIFNSWKSSENFELYYVYVGSWSLYGSFFTIFQYEKPFAQAANWNLNSNLLGANCQSKYQHCVTILQSGAQTNNRFHRNISFEFSTSLLTNLLEQKGKYDNRPRYKYDISWIPVCIREPKYRMDRTTPQPSPLLYFIFWLKEWGNIELQKPHGFNTRG